MVLVLQNRQCFVDWIQVTVLEDKLVFISVVQGLGENLGSALDEA